jgi:hypothetical protein
MWVVLAVGLAFCIAAVASHAQQRPSIHDQSVLGSGNYALAGTTGIDETANRASIAGYTLLQTIPAAVNLRYGLLIQAQCTAGLLVGLADAAGAVTYIALGAAPAVNGQGGSLNLRDLPYSGVITIYSTSASCVYGAWVGQN